MDGAAKCLNKRSINDVCFSQGPNLINDLTQVLTRFRRYNVGIMGDVSKMFLKVKVPEKYRRYYRFLWCSRDGKTVRIYQFCGHLFGNKGSPTCAIFATQRNARDYLARYPRAVEMIIKSTIVDDHIDSVPTDEEAIEVIRQLVEIHDNIGLKIAKFNSNSKVVSDNIPEGTTKSDGMVSFDSYVADTPYAPDTEPKMPQVRTLGQQWNMVTDQLTFGEFPIEEVNWTKASCLSQFHKVFDPLGFAVPLMLEAKQFLQKLWSRAVDWKEPITEEEVEEWQRWLPNLNRLQEIRVDRVLLPGLPGNFKKIEVHVFSDASKDAYAAVAYIRLEYKDGGPVYTNFIQAKSKIVPRKVTRTIPKLELQGIELASALARHVAEPLEVKVETITLWSDSKTALQWLRMDPDHLLVLVHNRAKKIREHHEVEKLRWVAGEDNPADIPTRKKDFDEFNSRMTLWKEGPAFLRLSVDQWPILPALEQTSEVMQEVKKEFKIWRKDLNAFSMCDVPDDCFLSNRFSEYGKQRRIVAYVLRFIEMLRLKKTRTTGPLLVKEVKRAELCIVAVHQARCFEAQIAQLKRGELSVNHTLTKLGAEVHLESIFQDDYFEFEVLRLGGRIKQAAHVDRERRCPLLLDPKEELVTRLVRYYHQYVLHHGGGIKCLLCAVNRSFWVIGSINHLKKIISECVECRKANPRSRFTIMAPLPDERVPGNKKGIVPVFETVAVDAAGPWLTTQGRGKSQTKRWLLIFRCSLIGAVHLEILYDMSERSFLKALQRFAARHRKPKRIVCDQGTNFKGAQNALSEAWKGTLEKESGIEFRFSPAHAPHFNGLMERFVQAAKKALRPVLKDKLITDEDLATAFALCEEVINNRPLAWRGNPDHRDPEPITAAHFMMKGDIAASILPTFTDGRIEHSTR